MNGKVLGMRGSIPVSSISLSKTTADGEVGKTLQLTVSVWPANAIYSLTWSSSNTSVATVDQTGKVTFVGFGSATITATTNNNKSATCSVTVSPYIFCEYISNLTGAIDVNLGTVSGSVNLYVSSMYNGGQCNFVVKKRPAWLSYPPLGQVYEYGHIAYGGQVTVNYPVYGSRNINDNELVLEQDSSGKILTYKFIF